jgi:hypothetical protein
MPVSDLLFIPAPLAVPPPASDSQGSPACLCYPIRLPKGLSSVVAWEGDDYAACCKWSHPTMVHRWAIRPEKPYSSQVAPIS